MTSNFYIDESGNTGDVLRSGVNYDFSGQPIFSLACIAFIAGVRPYVLHN
jgi:hypothetical protein